MSDVFSRWTSLNVGLSAEFFHLVRRYSSSAYTRIDGCTDRRLKMPLGVVRRKRRSTPIFFIKVSFYFTAY